MTEAFFTTREEKTGGICPGCGEEVREQITAVPGRELRHRMDCACDKRRREAERMEEYAEGMRILRREARREAGIPKRYQRESLSQLIPREGQQQAHRAMTDFVSAWRGDRRARGVLLVGATGCGKSTFAAAAANDLIDGYAFSEDEVRNCGVFGAPRRPFTSVRYVNVPMLFNELRNAMDEKTSAAHIIEQCASVPVLILDDLGAEHRTDYSRSVLLRIIDHRWCEQLPLIVTANARRMEDLEASTGERGRDRLEAICMPAAISCASQRRLGK